MTPRWTEREINELQPHLDEGIRLPLMVLMKERR